MIEPASLFHLAEIDELNARAALCAAHGKVGVIDGTHLEAQFRGDECFIIFATVGDPWEEILFVHLLDASFRALDEIALGQIYTPGSVRSLRVCGAGSLAFSFFADEEWRLEILPEPRVVWPWKIGSAVRYPRALRRHLLALSRTEPGAVTGE